VYLPCLDICVFIIFGALKACAGTLVTGNACRAARVLLLVCAATLTRGLFRYPSMVASAARRRASRAAAEARRARKRCSEGCTKDDGTVVADSGGSGNVFSPRTGSGSGDGGGGGGDGGGGAALGRCRPGEYDVCLPRGKDGLLMNIGEAEDHCG